LVGFVAIAGNVMAIMFVSHIVMHGQHGAKPDNAPN